MADAKQPCSLTQNKAVKPAFSRAAAASEVEIKFLVPNMRLEVFDNIEKYFENLGLVHVKLKDYHLLTRQLDTANRDLAKNGTSIRMRGNCVNGNLNSIAEADICLKTGKSQDESGAIRRGEYEARIASFNSPDIGALKEKFPIEEFPELHAALEGVDDDSLREYFRIDDIRHRFVVELPESITGLKGKQYFAELILDDVMFVLDIPGLEQPLFLGRDLEIEAETLTKPCDYDHSPGADKRVSSEMSAKQINRAMRAMREQIRTGAGLPLEINTESKAERGFVALDKTMKIIGDFIQKQGQDAKAEEAASVSFNFNGKSMRAINDNVMEQAANASRMMPDRIASQEKRGRPIARFVPPTQ